ncbi:MAG: hypothetical protein UET83_06020, partial [Eubacteriales bacterium]|nr:hypothetical protein [Eubacteriales bacterium]
FVILQLTSKQYPFEMDCYRFVRAKPNFTQDLLSKSKLYLCRDLVLFIFCMFCDENGILKATPRKLRLFDHAVLPNQKGCEQNVW